MLHEVFKDKKPDFQRLTDFGFSRVSGDYIYSTTIVDGQFSLDIRVSSEGRIHTDVIELSSDEPYVLHQVQGAYGAFVGSVREECQRILSAIAKECFSRDVFKSDYAKQVIAYICNTYQDEPEYLWEKFPRNAIFRRKDNQKWYAALLVVSTKKLGLNEDRVIEIIDLRIDPTSIDTVVDGKRYFPGYHMNKKHWLTICLDGSVSIQEIFQWIDSSYVLAKKQIKS